MKYKLEYLADPKAKDFQPLHIHGVGTFGAFRPNRKAMADHHKASEKALKAKKPLPDAPKPERIMILPCTEEVARVFDADRRDKRFAVHGLEEDAPMPPLQSPPGGNSLKKGGK